MANFLVPNHSAGSAVDGDTGRYGSAVAMVTPASPDPKAQGGDPDEQVKSHTHTHTGPGMSLGRWS